MAKQTLSVFRFHSIKTSPGFSCSSDDTPKTPASLEHGAGILERSCDERRPPPAEVHMLYLEDGPPGLVSSLGLASIYKPSKKGHLEGETSGLGDLLSMVIHLYGTY